MNIPVIHKIGWIHSLRWTNPYTEPPDGLPKIIAEWAGRAPTSEDFKKVLPSYRLGCGFAHCIAFPVKISNRKKLSPEANEVRKQRAKKTLEAKRVRKYLPLFADQIIEQEGLDWRNATDG